MKKNLYTFIRPLLFSLEPELAHRLTLSTLSLLEKTFFRKFLQQKFSLPRKVMGLTFKNPVGTCAGLDKNACYIDALSMLGFGFLEVGTVTPKPQQGNPQPRLFRLPQHSALINRMGFNNIGLEKFVEQLKNTAYQGILGVSITKNNDTSFANAIDDYITCFRGVYDYASYINIDVSCPNVQSSEDLQSRDFLANLLNSLKEEQIKLEQQQQRKVPIVVKISPDLTSEEIALTAELLLNYNIEGVVATNTTRTRKDVEQDLHAKEKGGLSGAPLFPLALDTVKQLKMYLGDTIPIIAVGGIQSAEDAKEMQAAGASLIQVYTGLVYKGSDLIKELMTAFN